MPKSRFHLLLEAKVEEEIQKRMEGLAEGIVDRDQYWGCVGEIRGLRGALRLCEDIERDINERIS